MWAWLLSILTGGVIISVCALIRHRFESELSGIYRSNRVSTGSSTPEFRSIRVRDIVTRISFKDQLVLRYILVYWLGTSTMGSSVLPGAGNDLRRSYVGKYITDLPKPALIIDRSKMRQHCQSLLDAVDFLGVDFRAHVKTHKVMRDSSQIPVSLLTLGQ